MLQFLDVSVLPDHMLVSIGLERPDQLATLSSTTHVAWALAAGGTLEDRPRYNKTRCFETFPFPALASPILGDSEAPNKTLVEKLRSLGEQLDAHRKRQQAAHPGLTLTGMYNVLEKLKSAEPLNDKEKIIHEQGLVSVLKSLHDEIDLAVLDAYGWGDLAGLMQVVNGNARVLECATGAADYPSPQPSPRIKSMIQLRFAGVERGLNTALLAPSPRSQEPLSTEAFVRGEGQADLPTPSNPHQTMTRSDAIRQLDETLLERLVALNSERAAEEARGLIRYLRPEFQNPSLRKLAPKQSEMDVDSDEDAPHATPLTKEKLAWPKTLPEQVRALLDVLKSDGEQSSTELVSRFKGVKPPKLGELLQTLVEMGRVRERKNGFSA
jgi:hypothetical protein